VWLPFGPPPFYSVFKNPCTDLLTQHWLCPPMTDGWTDGRMGKESALLLINEHDMSPMLRVNIQFRMMSEKGVIEHVEVIHSRSQIIIFRYIKEQEIFKLFTDMKNRV